MRIPCTHQAPQACPACDGVGALRKENRANRDETERREARWWLNTCAGLPEGYRPRPVDLPLVPREDHA